MIKILKRSLNVVFVMITVKKIPHNEKTPLLYKGIDPVYIFLNCYGEDI